MTIGDELDRDGGALDGLPVPISTPGWDNAPYLSAGHYITKDPDTGIQNVGNYRGQIKAPRRLGMNPSVELRAGIFAHWEKCKARGEPLPCAVVVGCPPVISYASVQKMPENLDELAVAGALAGGPINVVRAKTVDLLVPAEAEIVIEGLIDTELLEPEAPFGESHGYVNLQEYNAFMEVTAITRRRHPILTSFISQVTPSESSVIRQVAMEPVYLHHLKHDLGIQGVNRVAMHEPLTSLYAVIAIQFERGTPETRGLARPPRRFRAAPLRRQMDHRRRRGHRSGKRRRACSGRCPTAASRSTISRSLPHKDPGHGPRGPRDDGETAAVLINATAQGHLRAGRTAQARVHGAGARDLGAARAAAAHPADALARLRSRPLAGRSWSGRPRWRCERLLRAWYGACKETARRRRHEYAGAARLADGAKRYGALRMSEHLPIRRAPSWAHSLTGRHCATSVWRSSVRRS